MSNNDLVKRLRNAKAYIPEYDFHGNETNVDDEDTLYQEAVSRIEELEKALKACHDALDLAFDYDGDVFGIHHNDSLDAVIMAERALGMR
jgi:hypothetical protein